MGISAGKEFRTENIFEKLVFVINKKIKPLETNYLSSKFYCLQSFKHDINHSCFVHLLGHILAEEILIQVKVQLS